MQGLQLLWMRLSSLLPLDYQSVIGTAKTSDILASLELMLKGMIGIFVVMLIIFLIIYLLNRFTGQKKDNED